MSATIRFSIVLVTLAALQGCGGAIATTRTYRSTTPAGNQTANASNVLGIVNEDVLNDSEAAYRTCMTAHQDDARPQGFNAAEDYCFRRTTFGASAYGSPYYGQYMGAFTSAWNPGFNPMSAPIPSPAFGGGRWVMTPSGPRYMPGGTSTTQGTALDPMMAPAVVTMNAERTGAVDATTIEQGQAIAAYPVQGSLSAPSRRAVSRLSPDAVRELQERLRRSRAAHARH